ncbi:ABC transporter substrate-binding protein [Brevibacillus choshinensis]|uniref:Oligopeptide-binding protein AppA n=1 Tax=Brevibacillus choshinensis TaxID=54911 RepID=A0ABX7FL65_BRECH|nr:ABC transporter substrate-binding protein [Brevibacillus choshinensis]QRG66991.1 oligopeptide-binding protein AppA [Brevibacillus choshinensis]
MKRLWQPAVAMLLSLSVLISGCTSPGETAKPAESKTGQSSGTEKMVRIGVFNAPLSFNPLISSRDLSSAETSTLIFEPLLNRIKPLEFLPQLADSFDTEDKQTYTVKLNPKAKWTDGTPVTTEDVAYTLQLIANPKVESTLGSSIAFLEGVGPDGKLPEGQAEIAGLKVIDAQTFELHAKSPTDPNMIKEQFGMKFKPLPKHVFKDVNPEDLAKHPFMQKPDVTNGAFTFVKYEKDQYVEFAANKHYYRGAPKLDKIFVKIMPGTNLVAQLQSGEIEMNYGLGIGNLPDQDYDLIRKNESLRTKLEPQIGIQAMMFNAQTIRDAKVRQAIAHAVNRQLIVDNLMKGDAEIFDGLYPSLSAYQNKSLTPIAYDPEKAKSLLREAGWDSSRELAFIVPTGNQIREQSAQIIAENLKEVGIQAKITKFDFATVSQKLRKHEFDLALSGLYMNIDPDSSAYYHSEGLSNSSAYSNPEVDKLLEQGKAEADEKKRKEIYDQVQAQVQKDIPLLTLYYNPALVAVNKRVIKGEPRLFGTTYDVHEWDVVP